MTISSTKRTPLRTARTLATVAAAGALLALPASGVAAKPADAGKPSGKGKPAGTAAKGCAKAKSVGYVVSGTLVNYVAGVPATTTTPATDATVTLTVTNANSHARKSGDIADMDAVKKGVQVKGAAYTVAAGDAFTVKLNGYEGADTPSLGDKVHVKGKVALTKARCATAGTSVADRYGAVDVKKVTIGDRDADEAVAAS